MRIEEIEGIGSTYGVKLAEAGVATTEALLERGAGEGGRAALAASTGISSTLILEWVNHADLMRIDGVGSEYSDLLEAAGVDSAPELAERNAANLAVTFQGGRYGPPGDRPPGPHRGGGRRLDRPGEDPAQGRDPRWRIVRKASAVATGSTAAPMADAAHDEHAGHDHAAHDDHAGHDHAAHDHDHAEHDHAAHDHAGSRTITPWPRSRSGQRSGRDASRTRRAEPRRGDRAGRRGWWARIKRMFGG